MSKKELTIANLIGEAVLEINSLFKESFTMMFEKWYVYPRYLQEKSISLVIGGLKDEGKPFYIWLNGIEYTEDQIISEWKNSVLSHLNSEYPDLSELYIYWYVLPQFQFDTRDDRLFQYTKPTQVYSRLIITPELLEPNDQMEYVKFGS